MSKAKTRNKYRYILAKNANADIDKLKAENKESNLILAILWSYAYKYARNNQTCYLILIMNNINNIKDKMDQNYKQIDKINYCYENAPVVIGKAIINYVAIPILSLIALNYRSLLPNHFDNSFFNNFLIIFYYFLLIVILLIKVFFKIDDDLPDDK